MTHRNTSKTRGKTSVELLLGRRVRLPAIADFDLCEPILFKANEKTKTVPATLIIRKGLNTSFIQPENSARTSETVKIYLSQIFEIFRIPKTLVSDKGPEFVIGALNSDVKQWGSRK